MRLAALGHTAPSDAAMAEARRLRRPASRACAPISPRPPARRRASSPGRTAPASAHWALSAGTPTSTKAWRRATANLLGALDGELAAIEKNMGDAWQQTVVAVITEFGRTACIKGTNGTDHGTGTVAFFAGGRSGRARDRRFAGTEGGPPLRGARPETHHRPARRSRRGCSGIICEWKSARSPAPCFPTAPTSLRSPVWSVSQSRQASLMRSWGCYVSSHRSAARRLRHHSAVRQLLAAGQQDDAGPGVMRMSIPRVCELEFLASSNTNWRRPDSPSRHGCWKKMCSDVVPMSGGNASPNCLKSPRACH